MRGMRWAAVGAVGLMALAGGGCGGSTGTGIATLCESPNTCRRCSEVGSVSYATELWVHIQEDLDDSEAKRRFAAMSDRPLDERTGRLRAWAQEEGQTECPLADTLEEVHRAASESP